MRNKAFNANFWGGSLMYDPSYCCSLLCRRVFTFLPPRFPPVYSDLNTLIRVWYIRKACETLALDLRGYGTHLVAPETPVADDDVAQRRRPPPQERCATAGGATAASRAQRRAMTKAWSSSATEGEKDQSAGAGDSSKPPPFGAVRGTTVQEARITVVNEKVSLRVRIR